MENRIIGSREGKLHPSLADKSIMESFTAEWTGRNRVTNYSGARPRSHLSLCLTLANCLAASGRTFSMFSGVGSILLISTMALAMPLIIT